MSNRNLIIGGIVVIVLLVLAFQWVERDSSDYSMREGIDETAESLREAGDETADSMRETGDEFAREMNTR